MPVRLAEWRAVAEMAQSAVATSTGALLNLPLNESLAARVGALVAAEAACCPFLSSTLRTTDGHLQLYIDAPPGAEELAQITRLAVPVAEDNP